MENRLEVIIGSHPQKKYVRRSIKRLKEKLPINIRSLDGTLVPLICQDYVQKDSVRQCTFSVPSEFYLDHLENPQGLTCTYNQEKNMVLVTLTHSPTYFTHWQITLKESSE
jgi:hypothetical protein